MSEKWVSILIFTIISCYTQPLLLPKTSYVPIKIESKNSDTYSFRILFNSHLVPETLPFVCSSNNVTLFLVTSSKIDVVSPPKRDVMYRNVIRKYDVAPINLWQYYKRRPIKGQEFIRVIWLWMQVISIVKDGANVNIRSLVQFYKKKWC